MAYDEQLSLRVRQVMATIPGVSERKMFGGIAFMVNGNMCCGVVNRDLMVRVGAEDYAAALQQPHARKMDFTGKPLRGFVYVSEKGIVKDTDLNRWISRACQFVTTLSKK